MAKRKPVKRYKKGGSSGQGGSRDSAGNKDYGGKSQDGRDFAREDKGWGGGGGDKQGFQASADVAAAAQQAKLGGGGGGGIADMVQNPVAGRAASRAVETVAQGMDQNVLDAVAQADIGGKGLAGMTGPGGRGAAGATGGTPLAQEMVKGSFGQQPATGTAMYDAAGNVVGSYMGEPVPGALGQTDRVYMENPDYFAMPGALPPPSAPPQIASMDIRGRPLGARDFAAIPDPYMSPDVGMPAPDAAIMASNFRPRLDGQQIDMPAMGDFGIPTGPGDFTIPGAMTQSPMKPGSSAFTTGTQLPGIDGAPARQLSQLGAQTIPGAPSFDAAVTANPAAAPMSAPATPPSVPFSPPPVASDSAFAQGALSASGISADTSATAQGVPHGSFAPMAGGPVLAGGLLAMGANAINPLMQGRLFGEGGIFPADSRAGMSAADIAAEIAAQGGSPDRETGQGMGQDLLLPPAPPGYQPSAATPPPYVQPPIPQLSPATPTPYYQSYNDLMSAVRRGRPMGMAAGGAVSPGMQNAFTPGSYYASYDPRRRGLGGM